MIHHLRRPFIVATMFVFAPLTANLPSESGASHLAEEVAAPQGGVTGFTLKLIGVTRGQTLRYTWANVLAPDAGTQEAEPVRVRFTLFAPDGSVIRQTATPAPAVGELQSFDVARDDVDLPGEPGTGRLQLRVEVAIVFSRVNSRDAAVSENSVARFPGSLEIINPDGSTQAHSSAELATLLDFEFEGQ